MAGPLDQPQEEQAPQGKQNSVNKDDVEIVTRLGIQLLSKGGAMKQIQEALQSSKDPAQVIGTFIAQMMAQILEQVSSEVDIDPRAFLANGGFLDTILNYIEKKLGLPEEFSDQIYNQVLEVIKAAATNPQQAGAGQPQQGAPASQTAPGGMPSGF